MKSLFMSLAERFVVFVSSVPVVEVTPFPPPNSAAKNLSISLALP